MNKEQRIILVRIIVSALLTLCVRLAQDKLGSTLALLAYLAVFIIIAYDIVLEVVKHIFRFKLSNIFDEEFLMTLASVCAFALGECAEAVIIMLFYQIGELFTDCAVDKSRDSIKSLMDIRPDYANLITEDGIKRVSPEAVRIGDVISVKPGEKIPLDGIVKKGASYINAQALTGESLPQFVAVGDRVTSGCINTSGLLEVETSAEFGDSTVSKILALVENTYDKKATSEKFINKFAKVYTPAVVICAFLLALLPPLITGSLAFQTWIHRALIFLVVSCPCALVISVPLAFFGGLGSASRRGILIKGSGCLEHISEIKSLAFDKTGTLTKGEFTITRIECLSGFDEATVKTLSAAAEFHSNHPLARAVFESCNKDAQINPDIIQSYNETAGQGVSAEIMYDDRVLSVLAGNAKLMQSHGITVKEPEYPCIMLAIDGTLAGIIALADEVKEESVKAVEELKQFGVKITMLTGDTEQAARPISEKLNIDMKAGLMPQDKVAYIKEITGNTYGMTAFAGDGINDAPVLSTADIGIAMGGIGSDAAIEAADVVIMDDNPRKIADAMRISRRTLNIAKQNIIFALAVKALVLILGALGYAGMYFAVFADVGVSLIAVLNSLRALKTPKKDAACTIKNAVPNPEN